MFISESTWKRKKYEKYVYLNMYIIAITSTTTTTTTTTNNNNNNNNSNKIINKTVYVNISKQYIVIT